MKHLVLAVIAMLLAAGALGAVAAEDDVERLAQTIFALSNKARQENGVRPVAQLNYLKDAARGHAEEMARLDYFSHTSPTAGQESQKDRIERCGGWDLSITENIYRGISVPESELADEVLYAWLNSPIHRANLLNPKFNSMGIGVARVGKTEWAITQLLTLQAVAIESYQATPEGGGFKVSLKGHVVEGTAKGGIFYQDKLVRSWDSGNFNSQFTVDGRGKLQIGQLQPDGGYSVEIEFPVDARVTIPVRSLAHP